MNYDRNLLSAGRYKAYAKSAIEKLSQNGGPMIEMAWDVYDGEDKVEVKSYLTAKMGWMIDGLKKAIGMEVETSKAGSISASEIVDHWVMLDIDLVESKRDGYPINQVIKYLPYEGEVSSIAKEEKVPF